eukprot:4296647-Amphidinium_carterae.1
MHPNGRVKRKKTEAVKGKCGIAGKDPQWGVIAQGSHAPHVPRRQPCRLIIEPNDAYAIPCTHQDALHIHTACLHLAHVLE